MNTQERKTGKGLYTIGLDYGTLSGRALLVDIGNGEVRAEAAMDYPHAVMNSELPSGVPVPRGWAFQHPQDYLDVLEYIVPTVVRESGSGKNHRSGGGFYRMYADQFE